MPKYLTILLLALLASAPMRAQVLTKRIVIVNGGQFGNPAEPTNVQLYDPADGSYTTLDSIGENSTQDLLIDGSFAYVAASDSIVKYDLLTNQRVAAAAFGGVSTVTLALSEDYLLVGNFFLPFGSTAPYPNNLRVFDRETLAFVDSIPALSRPVKGIVVQGDTAYVSQNFTASTFADSAGFLCKVLLSTLEVVDTVEVNQNDEDLGPLLIQDSVIYGLNGASNTITRYDPGTGAVSTFATSVDLQVGTYGSRFTLDESGRLFTLFDGGIGELDLATGNAPQGTLFDTVISAMVLDTVNERFYITQTDFFSYTGGIIYDENGNRLDTLLVGFAPEAIGAAYNAVPTAQDDQVTLNLNGTSTLLADVLANDSDPDARVAPTLSIITQPTLGIASIDGQQIEYGAGGLTGQDSLQYAVADGWGDRDSAWLFIDVVPINPQVSAKRVVILNGGQFNNPAEPTNLQVFDPGTGQYQTLDTIGENSAQDLLIDGPFAYAAASDSVVKYDLTTNERIAAAAFGGESTVTLALSDSFLLVGNFFLPFGSTDPYGRNLLVYDRETLAFVDSIPALSRPVKGIVVQGDTAYVSQNFTSSSFSDSAGYLCKVLLSTLTVVDTVAVNQNDEDLGPLLVRDSVIYGLNGASNSLTTFDPRDGSVSTDPLNIDLQNGTYGSTFTLDAEGTLYTRFDGAIGSFDLVNRSVIRAGIVGLFPTAFVQDTLSQRFYTAQTDFTPAFNQGLVFDINGTLLDSLEVGVTTENIEVAYNLVPMAMNDEVVLDLAVAADALVPVLENDQDADNRKGLSAEIITPPLQGTAVLSDDTLRYTPLAGTFGLDSVQYVITDEWGDRDSAWAFIDVQLDTRLTEEEATSLRIFPNPTSQRITLAFAQRWEGTVALFDLQGRRLAQRQVAGQARLSWSLADLPAGTYLLRGVGQGGNWQQRVIKL